MANHAEDQISPGKGHSTGQRATYLPAIDGIRFFAIFHIFLFHLWSVWDGRPEGMDGLMASFDQAPGPLLAFLSNGWMSTSLFFLLSGFILAYLYWGADGSLSMPRRRFWALRCARIFPIHLIVILIVILLLFPWYLSQGRPLSLLIPSALAQIALVQAWVPPWVPIWSWPTWTISALLFLYLIMPWLMTTMNGWSRRRMIWALIAMPFVSMLPALGYAAYMATGRSPSMNLDIFIANFPLFWVPYFVAGMLMTRVFVLSRHISASSSPTLLAWGDLAFLVVVGLALVPDIGQPLKFFVRQGLTMPLFVVILLDLARGRGIVARLFSLPGMRFLGETGYSIFIWQIVVLIAANISYAVNPAIGPYQIWVSILLMMALAIPSTYVIEKPLTRAIRKKWIDRRI